MRVETYEWPAWLASALVNGDESSVETPEDRDILEDVYAWLEVNGARVVGCEDGDEFTRSFDYPLNDSLAGASQKYTVMYDDESEG